MSKRRPQGAGGAKSGLLQQQLKYLTLTGEHVSWKEGDLNIRDIVSTFEYQKVVLACATFEFFSLLKLPKDSVESQVFKNIMQTLKSFSNFNLRIRKL